MPRNAPRSPTATKSGGRRRPASWRRRAPTFLLLITVRYFEAGATAKAIVAGGASVGLMISPVVVSVVGNLGRPPSRAAAALAAFGALTLLVMAAVPVLPVYVIGSVLATTSASAMIPLLTHMFRRTTRSSGAGSCSPAR